MIRLATRVSLGAGRESLVRLVLTAVGVALGVCLLLFATVASTALHQHDVRNGWVNTSEHNRQPAQDESTTDPLLWRLTNDRFEGRDVIRVDVAAAGARSPVPAWLPRLPAPGEIAASPSMAALLRRTDPALLGDRYPGRVTETAGPQALESADQLVVVVGYTPSQLRNEPGAMIVHSIEAAPVDHSFTRFVRIVLLIGGLGLLLPIIVFVSTATRLAAARREQRLAAMRLAGATPRQADVVAGVEAALAAVAGTALGFVAFFVLRPYAARIPLDGYAFYPSDLRLPVGWAVVIAFGVPALAVAAALVSLRRVRISPLGVVRSGEPKRPARWRLAVLPAGIVVFWLSLAVHQQGAALDSFGRRFMIGASFCLIIAGIIACGPWLTAVVARGMDRVGGRAPSLLAARRLEHDPAAGFRAISGLILAVFVVSLVSALGASATKADGVHSSAISPDTVGIVASLRYPVEGGKVTVGQDVQSHIGAAAGARLVADLGLTPGVQRVAAVHALPGAPRPVPLVIDKEHHEIVKIQNVGVLRCADAPVIGLRACPGSFLAVDLNDDLTGGRVGRVPVPGRVSPQTFAQLPLAAVAVVTDGRAATIERVRTELDRAFPGATAETGRDLYADENQQLHDTEHLADVALLVTLLIAGCSLAVSVAGGLVERKRPFALLRLAGVRLRELHRVVLAEAAAPLLIVSAVSVALGFAVDAILVALVGGRQSFQLPPVGYWVSLVGGLACALAIVGATLPLLDRVTSLETARFE